MNKLYAGIDVHSTTNYIYLMKPDGTKHSSFTAKNNPVGSATITENIITALSSLELTDTVIGIESTGVYGENLMMYLREDASLGKYNRKFHVLNAKQVKKFKESYSDLPKNDPVDAFVIADNLRFGRITKEIYMDDYKYKALQNLTRGGCQVYCVNS